MEQKVESSCRPEYTQRFCRTGNNLKCGKSYLWPQNQEDCRNLTLPPGLLWSLTCELHVLAHIQNLRILILSTIAKGCNPVSSSHEVHHELNDGNCLCENIVPQYYLLRLSQLLLSPIFLLPCPLWVQAWSTVSKIVLRNERRNCSAIL